MVLLQFQVSDHNPQYPSWKSVESCLLLSFLAQWCSTKHLIGRSVMCCFHIRIFLSSNHWNALWCRRSLSITAAWPTLLPPTSGFNYEKLSERVRNDRFCRNWWAPKRRISQSTNPHVSLRQAGCGRNQANTKTSIKVEPGMKITQCFASMRELRLKEWKEYYLFIASSHCWN